MSRRTGYACSQCKKMCNMCVRLDAVRRVAVCGDACLQTVRIDDYYPAANLATTYLTRQEFGHQAWIVLHSVARAFAASPTAHESRTMAAFIDSFAHMYPCARCRSHMLPMFAAHPPDVASRAALVQWVGQRHNEVSARLGKRQYDVTGGAKSAPSDAAAAAHAVSPFESGAEGNLCVRDVSPQRLGSATWMLLHSMAASYQYADSVTRHHVYHTMRFYDSLQYVYPHANARSALRAELHSAASRMEKILADRRTYMAWLCEFHNRVNAKLGKAVYSTKRIRAHLEAYRCDVDGGGGGGGDTLLEAGEPR